MRYRTLALLAILIPFAGLAIAGGPLRVTGPAAIQPGQSFVWDTVTMPIQFTVDGGPMSKTPSGVTVVDNVAGLARVKSMFQTWQSVPTTAISFNYAGIITASGLFTDGDVDTVAEYSAVKGSCNSGTQSPVIFDANGSVFQGLGLDPLVIGFAGFCKIDPQTGHILSAQVVLNGVFQDGISNSSTLNFEMTADQFDEAITHELGHFSGLDHSQINVQVLTQSAGACNLDDLAGLPLMFPIAQCQARKSAGLPVLAPDDMAWISNLYPGSGFASGYGTISGFIYFSDGVSQVQGLNVIAQRVDDPNTPQNEAKRFGVSVVSGYRFTGNPGQSITGNNSAGSAFGSRNPMLIGFYEIPVPPGIYTVRVENIQPSFTGGSGVGPLTVPIVMNAANEYWHPYQSASDNAQKKGLITIQAGQTVTGIDIILNFTLPRFDKNEDSPLALRWPVVYFALFKWIDCRRGGWGS